MRRPRLLWTSAFAAVGLAAWPAPAQQQPQRAASPSTSASSTAPADLVADPSMATRPARYLLRNGQDYLNYREYDRALNFFRAIEKRQAELSDQERQLLRQGIARAQQGKREAVNGPHVVAVPKGRPTNPPGSFALARPTPNARPAVASRPAAPEPVQLTSGTMATAEVAVESQPAVVAIVPSPAGVIPSDPAPLDRPSGAAVMSSPAVGTAEAMELPTLPAAPTEPLPEVAPLPQAAPIAPEVAPVSSLPELPTAPTPDPASPMELPTLGTPSQLPSPVSPVAEPAEATPAVASLPTSNDLPTLPTADTPVAEPQPAPAPMADPAPMQAPSPAPARSQDPATVPAQAQPEQQPAPSPEPPPVAEASASPVGVDPDRSASVPFGANLSRDSFLSERDHAEIARLAQRSSDNPASDRAAAANPTADPYASTGTTQGSTRLELQRAPSPTEARPIRRIPVPEEFVPLGRRDWNPNRKYWAAAGTCHMILYFQDPALERYGQGVEQALGPRGRFFSYPLDDPRQSNQRNQILQPFYSIGKFCFQVGTLPYKLVVDPPWEAEYDLGYYRPGDKIPPDTIMMTPTGVGPPLKGRKY